ncbi:MAG: ketoacyl-ACP synthase III, partial [Clostridia bacterium]|nr:ketoacyl-ACP synthase III [Clostridia bacterium]
MSFRILGTGSAVPEKILTNDELSALVDTNDEWITTRVGISERRIAVTETTSDLAYAASVRALEMAEAEADSIDLIIAATITSDDVSPTTAGMVQRRLGASCPAFDINSACSGFLFALETAAAYFASGKYRRILVVGAERISKIVDWKDRGTCVIFGDGAGAALLEAGENYLASAVHTYGGDEVIKIPNYHGTSIFNENEPIDPTIIMHGQETFKFAVTEMTNHVQKLTADVGITPNDLAFIVPHQANMRIISMAMKKLGLPEEKFVVNIQKYGNTAAASVPIAL